MQSFFGDVCDKLRLRNDPVYDPKSQLFACTITSRHKHSSFDSFRDNLYRDIEQLPIDAVLEYHERAKTKLHAHGIVGMPRNVSIHKGNNRFTYGDFTFTLEKVSNFHAWIKYCKKSLSHTLEWNNDIFNGIFQTFYKYKPQHCKIS